MTMKRTIVLAFSLYSAALVFSPAAGADSPPAWAFPVNPPGHPAPVDDGKTRTLPGSPAQFTFTQLRDFFTPPDWYPNEHPAMPPLAAHGAKPDSFACGFCHLPSGNGRPENANIAGLPADYIVAQVRDMKSGARNSSLPERYPQMLMWKVAAQAATEPGLEEAAKYFAALKAKSVTKVVEAETIPKIENTHWIMKKSDAGGTELIGNRLIEVPDDFASFEKRDGHVTYTAYVPPGSLAKGEALVKTGAGKTAACATCHGPELKGLGQVPPIAGRSPTYIARQLYDIQSGARNGAAAALMKPVVAGLNNDDFIAITAYLATLEP
jgi:cytochrome c553